MQLPVKHSRVNIELLHPELIRRAQLLVAAIPGLKVSSGARAEGWPSTPSRPAPVNSQWYFWEGYEKRLPGFNMAADPRTRKANGWRGSRHMTQDDGFAHAIDWKRPRNVPWSVIHKTAELYGLKFNLADRRPHPDGYGEWAEDWHCVAEISPGDWLPITGETDSPRQINASNQKAHNLKGAARIALIEAGNVASKHGIRRGNRGPAVQVVQSLLRNHGGRLSADGVFGPHTERVTKNFQRLNRLYPDGVVGPKTWAVLSNNEW